ncbi:hypothetical protein GOL30_10375 [Sinorhizobium medicae]|uniref:Lipocalin-like domain-containing protein n=3 Tax=Sinorhizobium medicae TaxID=110321 RepID=A0A6G1WEH2_9HYPH|nr:hypothetical protein Smed_2348 [Sinorhizobium medicae WSM419]MBO1959118.1 lipocalin-like domain-containing protein [Sinorhizobium medicae]MDX0405669.1 hypothetical protein [Sinorhizobium medicae]MDX0411189.1 hypothetical protein [Sinorhizobium medicae]MDX0417643.1 hypothetical protein [Sinorhizobium medicae]
MTSLPFTAPYCRNCASRRGYANCRPSAESFGRFDFTPTSKRRMHMKTELQFAMFALALAVSGPALAQDNKASIVGAWRMTSLQFTNSEGSLAEVPYSGQVIFSQSGSLSVQAMDPDPAAKPTTYTANGYEAYYGPVEIDEAKNTFTITVESSLVRDLIGQKLVRKFQVTEDQLVILPADPSEGWRVTYERF